MKRVRALFSTSEDEYQAALNGLNIFFGAILGVTLAGTEGLATLPYITLLTTISGIVVAILYIPASNHRIWYALALLVVLTFVLLAQGEDDAAIAAVPLPDKLVETLIVWTAATSLVQFAPRRKLSPPAH